MNRNSPVITRVTGDHVRDIFPPYSNAGYWPMPVVIVNDDDGPYIYTPQQANSHAPRCGGCSAPVSSKYISGHSGIFLHNLKVGRTEL